MIVVVVVVVVMAVTLVTRHRCHEGEQRDRARSRHGVAKIMCSHSLKIFQNHYQANIQCITAPTVDRRHQKAMPQLYNCVQNIPADLVCTSSSVFLPVSPSTNFQVSVSPVQISHSGQCRHTSLFVFRDMRER